MLILLYSALPACTVQCVTVATLFFVKYGGLLVWQCLFCRLRSNRGNNFGWGIVLARAGVYTMLYIV